MNASATNCHICGRSDNVCGRDLERSYAGCVYRGVEKCDLPDQVATEPSFPTAYHLKMKATIERRSYWAKRVEGIVRDIEKASSESESKKERNMIKDAVQEWLDHTLFD